MSDETFNMLSVLLQSAIQKASGPNRLRLMKALDELILVKYRPSVL